MRQFLKWSCMLFAAFAATAIQHARAQQIIVAKKQKDAVALVSASQTASIYVDPSDARLVHKAASLLQADIEMVTGRKPAVVHQMPADGNGVIIIGSIHHSNTIKELIASKKIDAKNISGKWEAFSMQTISPFQGAGHAVVIAGSDKRGTAYGVFELSKQIGVSPWYWWADVPVKKKAELFVKKGLYSYGPPAVKYRGIFLNDEAPALSGWSKATFGGFNHAFYEKVFELMLRLKSNYLWPAMWGNAFYDDDPLNQQVADEYGIVIGTSHHEPLMRAHDEWRRYGKGKWNYDSNETRLKEFWKGGLQRAGKTEKIVSVGMRGDGDEPMTRGTAIALLERIVRDQRSIIEEVTGKPASETPQLWALYKEVQDYYDKGMRVPDDITLLLCDDNWGNIRKLPKLSDKPRSGGYGIYYHFDYVGGPRNYKWINTNNIARVWEQMHLAYEYGADRIWIVNVGDLKPMEFPTSFFLDHAWDPKRWNEDNLEHYYTEWASEQFGPAHAKEIGSIIRDYSRYNARRKPELLDANTFSLANYNEAERVTEDYKKLAAQAEHINQQLPAAYRDAYFQLVLHPVKASANLYELYFAVAMNRRLASQGNIAANAWADKAKQLYIYDSLLSIRYNKEIANGKWNHMMDQTHIGYTYWQQPPNNRMPAIKYVNADSVKAISTAGLAAEKDLPGKNALIPRNARGNVFHEHNGYVSIEAEHFTRAMHTNGIKWKIIPGIGKTGSGLYPFPVTAPPQSISPNGPHVEFEVYVYDTGRAVVNAYFSPTLNFHNEDGLKYAISIDDEEPQIISINKEDNNVRVWESWVANNIIIKRSEHLLSRPGRHVLKYWMVSPAVVLQKIVIDFGGAKPSYLGPPETKYIK